MQTCSKCNALSPDAARHCISCQVDLIEFSTAAVALKRFQGNSRVHHIILSVAEDACPACQELQGAYTKENTPHLPVEGCSHANGCRCFYQPVLTEIFPKE